MRQLPNNLGQKASFAILGRGRVGRAWAAYLETKGHCVQVFTRDDLYPKLATPLIQTHFKAIFLAVSDTSLPEVSSLLIDAGIKAPLLHFSGSLSLWGTLALHPLYSFTEREISFEEMEEIPLIVNPSEGDRAQALLTGFKNPIIELKQSKDALYHALCVCVGNIPANIQAHSLQLLEEDFGLPLEAVAPFLVSLILNLGESEKSAGPLARRDLFTLKKHLEALDTKSDYLKTAYQEMIRDSWPEGFEELEASL
jgi:hypothetical protein